MNKLQDVLDTIKPGVSVEVVRPGRSRLFEVLRNGKPVRTIMVLSQFLAILRPVLESRAKTFVMTIGGDSEMARSHVFFQDGKPLALVFGVGDKAVTLLTFDKNCAWRNAATIALDRSGFSALARCPRQSTLAVLLGRLSSAKESSADFLWPALPRGNLASYLYCQGEHGACYTLDFNTAPINLFSGAAPFPENLGSAAVEEYSAHVSAIRQAWTVLRSKACAKTPSYEQVGAVADGSHRVVVFCDTSDHVLDVDLAGLAAQDAFSESSWIHWGLFIEGNPVPRFIVQDPTGDAVLQCRKVDNQLELIIGAPSAAPVQLCHDYAYQGDVSRSDFLARWLNQAEKGEQGPGHLVELSQCSTQENAFCSEIRGGAHQGHSRHTLGFASGSEPCPA